VASVFTADLGMLDSEREEYATNLATQASNQVTATKASPGSLVDARRLLALALQLSPRNKRAVVVNFQLSKGILPDGIDGNYSQPVLARLILTRGQLLVKQGGEENQRLARFFIQLAAELDPKNEDAVYASEVQRLDHGAEKSLIDAPKCIAQLFLVGVGHDVGESFGSACWRRSSAESRSSCPFLTITRWVSVWMAVSPHYRQLGIQNH
jgi:hypothetical protein